MITYSFSYTTIIASSIVFCDDINQHSSKPYANDLYLNPGGIVNTFEEVIEYIHNPNDRLWHHLLSIKENSINIPILQDKSGNVFRYAQDLDTSLNNIRIVTGYGADQMAKFAE